MVTARETTRTNDKRLAIDYIHDWDSNHGGTFTYQTLGQ